MPPLIRWEGSYCELTSTYGAKGVLRIIKSRTKKSGRRERVIEEILIDRSSIRCLYRLLGIAYPWVGSGSGCRLQLGDSIKKTKRLLASLGEGK